MAAKVHRAMSMLNSKVSRGVSALVSNWPGLGHMTWLQKNAKINIWHFSSLLWEVAPVKKERGWKWRYTGQQALLQEGRTAECESQKLPKWCLSEVTCRLKEGGTGRTRGLSLLCLFFFFFYYSFVHTRLGSFLPPAPTPSLTTHSTPSLSPQPPQYPAETILPLFLILL
jgi:hypothetical protein